MLISSENMGGYGNEKILNNYCPILEYCSCTNSPELESGEIKTFQVLKDAIDQKAKSRAIIDARDLFLDNKLTNMHYLCCSWNFHGAKTGH